MPKKNDSKIDIGSEPAQPLKRSKRVVKRKAPLADEGVKIKMKKGVVHKTESKRSLKEALEKPSVAPSAQSSSEKLVVKPLKQQMGASSDGAQIKMSVAPSIQSVSKKSVEEQLNEQMIESVQAKKGRKKKAIKYEIDCSGINMDTTNFRKDLWNRTKNGKLNLAKNVRIKQAGDIIYLTSRSYVSKKCIRSNVHFLTTTYFKQKKIDRAVHVVGNKNAYKLIYK